MLALPRRFLVRVDDFPAWNGDMKGFVPALELLEFHEILSGHGVPYLLAVTPQPSLRPIRVGNRETRQLSGDEVQIIRKVSSEGTFLALHGVTHQTRAKGQYSEFLGMDILSFCERIRYGCAAFKHLTGVAAEIFVPPFNRISVEQLNLLATRFCIICGGPESERYLGRRPMERLSSRSYYLPSYFPYYGRASEILSTLDNDACGDPVCLTLHWEWERRRNYAELALFCESIQSRTISWKDFLDESSG
jgi:hypothetical protein